MAPDQTAPIPAGWYPDPYGVSEMRWWDGQNWTDSIHPPPAPAASAAMPPPVSAPVATPVEAQVETKEQEQTPVSPAPVPESQSDAQSNPFGELGFDIPPSEPAAATPQAAPVTPTPAPQTPTPQTPATPVHDLQSPSLPSRRELRLRMEREAETTPTFDATPAEVSTPISAPTTAHSPQPPTASAPVPDSSTPTAFDWLSDTNSGGLDLPAVVPAPQSQQPSQAVPSFETAPSGFPPFGESTGSTPVSAASTNGFPAPQSAASNAWAREPESDATSDDPMRFTATRKATVSSWFIAVMPLFAGILSVSAVKAQENYPRYVPEGLEWWMLVGAAIAILYLVTLILAIADRRKLDWAGYYRPAHWLWALLGAPVYLAVRTLSVKRETGRNSLVLWVWLLLTGVLIGAWFAAGSFAPDLIAGYTLPFL